jgi:predicted transcriptional regulator
MRTNHRRKVTRYIFATVRRLLKTKVYTQKEIADMVLLTQATVSKISQHSKHKDYFEAMNRNNRKNGDTPVYEFETTIIDKSNKRHSLTDDQVKAVIKEYENNSVCDVDIFEINLAEIADRFHIPVHKLRIKA